MIRKKKEMKKRVGKGDKKKGQNNGNFPTQRNFEWEKGQKFWGNI